MSTASTLVQSKPIAKPMLPRPDELEKRLRELHPGLVIFQPSSEWLPTEVFGLTFFMPPHLPGQWAEHPVKVDQNGQPLKVLCDGRLVLRNRYLTQKDSSGKVIDGQDAASMVKYLCHPNQYGQLGVVWLPGISRDEDQQQIDASIAAFSVFQRKQDEDIVAARAAFKAAFKNNPKHKGLLVPPPSPKENAAIERLESARFSGASVETYSYSCQHDDCPGYATNDWQKFSLHCKRAHDIEVESPALAAAKEVFDAQARATGGEAKTLTAEEAQKRRGEEQKPQLEAMGEHRDGGPALLAAVERAKSAISPEAMAARLPTPDSVEGSEQEARDVTAPPSDSPDAVQAWASEGGKRSKSKK